MRGEKDRQRRRFRNGAVVTAFRVLKMMPLCTVEKKERKKERGSLHQ